MDEPVPSTRDKPSPHPRPFHRARRWLRAFPIARPDLAHAVFAAVLAAFLFPQSVLILAGLDVDAGWAGTVLGAFVLLHVTLALRRRIPVTAYALACVSMLVVVVAPNGHQSGEQATVLAETPGAGDFPMLFLPSSLVFLPVLHGMARYASRRWAVAALLAAVIGSGLALVRISATVPASYPQLRYLSYVLLAMLISVSFAWGLGIAHVTRERLHAVEQAEAARAAVLAERARIARDMHDLVAHSLAVIVRQAEGGAMIAPQAPDRAVEALHTIADTGREALRDMRGLLGVLRDPQARPADAPAAGLDDLPALVERLRGCGLDVVLETTGPVGALTPAVELAVFHVVREALTNTVRHAGPGARAAVHLRWLPAQLEVQVSDDGGASARPSSPASGAAGDRPGGTSGAGVGLTGLRERLEAVGGTLSTPRVDPGFVVRARVPRRDGKVES